jgi:hypothetical protein
MSIFATTNAVGSSRTRAARADDGRQNRSSHRGVEELDVDVEGAWSSQRAFCACVRPMPAGLTISSDRSTCSSRKESRSTRNRFYRTGWNQVREWLRRVTSLRRSSVNALDSPRLPRVNCFERHDRYIWLGGPLASIRNLAAARHINIAHGRIHASRCRSKPSTRTDFLARHVAVTSAGRPQESDEVRADGNGAAARARSPAVE